MPQNIEKRGISQNVFDAFKLKYSNGKLEIPVFSSEGKKLFSKYRHDTGQNKYTYDPGSHAQLYGAHLAQHQDTIVLTEGELDTLVLWSHGIPAVSATSGCSSNYQDEWIEMLKDKTLYICYDNDEPGLKGAAKLKKTFPNATVLFLKDVNDISDYFEKHSEVKSIFKLTEGTLPEVVDDVYIPKTQEQLQDTDDRVLQAKQVPITDFAQFNRDKKMKCFFSGHQGEKTASLAYKPSNNTAKCFGCNKFVDSIGFYMELKGVDFPTALLEMVGPKPPVMIKESVVPVNQVKNDSKISEVTPIKKEPIHFLMTQDIKNPQVRKIGDNVKLVFENHTELTDILRYNSFAGVPEILMNNEWTPIEPFYLREIINQIQRLYPYHFDSGFEIMIKDEALNYAFSNRVSPPLEYMKTIKWDGTKRLDTWLTKVYGAKDNDYHQYIGRSWLKYMMRRLVYPGAQFDHVLVIKAGQGFGKSTIFRNLCNIGGKDYFTETADTPDNSKEFALNLQKNLVVEFAEGAITGYNDQRKVKSFITKTVDKYRPPYMKAAEEFPRQCIFAMTTNETEFLKDQTGERRYWLVNIPDTQKLGDWKWVKENNEQLLAEAMTLVDEPYQFMSNDAQEYMQDLIDGHKEIDPIEDVIYDWYDNLTIERKNKGITMKEGKTVILEDDTMKAHHSKYLDKSISGIYTNVLKLEPKKKRINGKPARVYIPTASTPMHQGELNVTPQDVSDDLNKPVDDDINPEDVPF